MTKSVVTVKIVVSGSQGSGKSRVANYIRGMLKCLETVEAIPVKLEITEKQTKN